MIIICCKNTSIVLQSSHALKGLRLNNCVCTLASKADEILSLLSCFCVGLIHALIYIYTYISLYYECKFILYLYGKYILSYKCINLWIDANVPTKQSYWLYHKIRIAILFAIQLAIQLAGKSASCIHQSTFHSRSRYTTLLLVFAATVGQQPIRNPNLIYWAFNWFPPTVACVVYHGSSRALSDS